MHKISWLNAPGTKGETWNPILFNGPMVRAILDGRKTQTRRVIKPQPRDCATRLPGVSVVRDYRTGHPELGKAYYAMIGGCWNSTEPFFPPYKPGDTLWVRETWRLFDRQVECACYEGCSCPPSGTPIFKASYQDDESKYRPSIHMPKWAARLFLRVTDVRAQRIRDITDADAKAEGIHFLDRGPGFASWGVDGKVLTEPEKDTPRHAFKALWDSIAKPGFKVTDNPWVWAYTFERCDKPKGWPHA